MLTACFALDQSCDYTGFQAAALTHAAQSLSGQRRALNMQEPELADGPTVDENIRPALASMQALLKEYEDVRHTAMLHCINEGVHAVLSALGEQLRQSSFDAESRGTD